ncbi:RdRP-domain-containing protein [Ramaria rubella]|nr:RdRP-domain-containing protein [Ramaria rubella]
MEIQLKDVARLANVYDVTRAIAKVLHGDAFIAAHCLDLSRLVNFSVDLERDNVPNSIRNGGTGTLTLPSVELGQKFLQFLRVRHVKVKVLGRRLSFLPTSVVPRPSLVHTLQKVPYQDPNIVQAKQAILAELIDQLPVRTLQFGVFFRQPPRLVFSPEWEQDYRERGDARLSFEYEHKLLRLKTGDHSDTQARSVVIKFVSLKRIYIGWDLGSPFILFHLPSPPALETESLYRSSEDNKHIRHRVGGFDEAHARIAPFAHQVRLVLKKETDLQHFADMCRKAEIQIPIKVPDGSIDIQRLDIFSSTNLRKINLFLEGLDWPVAFQCEALLCNLRLNALELLQLQPEIESLAQRDFRYASQVLRHYHTVMRSLRKDETFLAAYERAVQEYQQLLIDKKMPLDPAFFDAHHVSFTPTAMRLEGPYSHQSNRVIRMYADYQDFFIRVDFRDEDRLQYRWDREVDGASFVRERVGPLLRHGFKVAGRKFQFLGYSQSQLRTHSVFAMCPFNHSTKGWIDASRIRQELGIFDNIINFPALYAARVSQAFSGTEDSVWLHADQWEEMDDVAHHNRVFTEGVGTISVGLTELIWQKLCERRQRVPTAPFSPVAFQIRFGGYKGMVAVDPRLTGIFMRLRPSMRKFHVHESELIPLEIARAFEYPGRMYLNRPLIQILEDLGIPKETFLDLQAAAVADVQTAGNSLSNFASLLDSHAMGRAFSLSYLVRSLDSIGCELQHHDPARAVGTPFLRGLIDTAVLSVLRDLKHSARIPVPQSWNLVGVADEDGILGPGQIYACIWEQGAERPIFLEGPVMISRSPTVHPGDVQMVTAIGRPPPGSMYETEPMPNVVVFPCEGKRDLASCLGGGDLDGDLYLVCQFPGLLLDFNKIHAPGDYPPTTRKDLGRPSTIDDVADFVVEYINSDLVGLLSTNHLILSDQSSFGTLDRNCLKLAELCSIAVDYPKSGMPVNMDDTPRFLIPYKPDWKSDEIINPRRVDYYESTRAIGYLFRAITLEENTKELSFDPKTSILKKMERPTGRSFDPTDAISSALTPIVEKHLRNFFKAHVPTTIPVLFSRYCLQLKYICLTHTLTHDPDIRLREEEIIIGTILAKCAQARWRKDRVEQMRINASQLVILISAELIGPDTCATERLDMAWTAWNYSRANCNEFGHQSFGLIALELIFRALDELQESQERPGDLSKTVGKLTHNKFTRFNLA